MPGGSPVTVVPKPVPVVVMVPGYRVRIQVPVAGSPDRITLPVNNVHVGWITVITRGAEGLLTDPHDTKKFAPVDVHPDEFRTVMVCVPFTTAVKVVEVR